MEHRLYVGEEAEASGVGTIQQHSVFVEIVVEEADNETEIHRFAAVVGLIKACKTSRDVFDNAVLWFNDQFLFGEKRSFSNNETPEDALGRNPEDNNLIKRNGETGRWGGCYIPDGFAFAIGRDDPFGVHRQTGGQDCEARSGRPLSCSEENMDVVKNLLALDNRCQGCLFEYESSFFITDPNIPDSHRSVRWIVDKFVYPVSVVGNLFQEGGQNGCASGDGLVPASDPRSGGHHAERCRDDGGNDTDNHRCGDEACHGDSQDPQNETLVQPLYAVHLQVDPLTDGPRGYIDEAVWEYESGVQVDGMPYPRPNDDAYVDCENEDFNSFECSIEYNFLLAVDFAAFDQRQRPAGEHEIREKVVEHGENRITQDEAWQGNSHPHNPQTSDAGPNHRHDVVQLDVFYNDEAPHFVMQHPYWDKYGAPPEVDATCSGVANPDDVSEERSQAISARSPIVCDTDQDEGEFHSHSGNQTIRSE